MKLSSGTKIKLAVLLTFLSSLFLATGRIDSGQWISFVEWVYASFAIANVVSPLAHGGAEKLTGK